MKCKSNKELRIGSLNVRGLNKEGKRHSMFKWFLKQKFDVLLLQEVYSDVDIENVWSREWGTQIIFAHGTKHSKGVAIMTRPGLDIKITVEKEDKEGRYLICKMYFEEETFVLVNVYAPNKLNEKKVFLVKLSEILDKMEFQGDEKLICAGDWNTILDINLDKSGGTAVSNHSDTEVKTLIEMLDLIDIWRFRNPNIKRFTYRQKTPLIQTRLDYFLMSNNLYDHISDVDIIPSVWSDHSCITMNLHLLPLQEKGRGFWKFNSMHLQDDTFVTSVIKLIDTLKKNFAFIQDKRVVWELVKYELRNFCMKFGANKRKEINGKIKDLSESLLIAERKLGDRTSIETQEKYDEIKNELKEIETEQSKGAILRSKAKWIEEGEKPTKYFFDLEKRNYIKKTIRKLKLPDGTVTTNKEEILQIQKSFYETLYASNKHDNTDEIAYFMSTNVSSLSENLKLLCEGPVTVDECHKVLKLFKNNKSPGNDGFTAEFYKEFWRFMSDVLIDCYNYSYKHGELILFSTASNTFSFRKTW